MDYVMSALNGFNGEYYVPGTFNCVNNTRYFQLDLIKTESTFATTNTGTLEGIETDVFSATATASGYLPDAIYYCYFVPGTAFKVWDTHYKTFLSLEDFEQAFLQNILGNLLTFSDIYKKVEVAAEAGDFDVVVY